MICYKGRSFCSASLTCGNNNCDVKLNMKQKEEAEKSELDISWVDYKDGPKCGGFVPVILDSDYQD